MKPFFHQTGREHMDTYKYLPTDLRSPFKELVCQNHGYHMCPGEQISNFILPKLLATLVRSPPGHVPGSIPIHLGILAVSTPLAVCTIELKFQLGSHSGETL